MFGGRIWTIGDHRLIRHFVLELDGVFLDGDGAFTPNEMLAKVAYRTGIHYPWLRLWLRPRRSLATIDCSEQQLLATIGLLNTHLVRDS